MYISREIQAQQFCCTNSSLRNIRAVCVHNILLFSFCDTCIKQSISCIYSALNLSWVKFWGLFGGFFWHSNIFFYSWSMKLTLWPSTGSYPPVWKYSPHIAVGMISTAKKNIRIIDSSHLRARRDTRKLAHCCCFARGKVKRAQGAHTHKAGWR